MVEIIEKSYVAEFSPFYIWQTESYGKHFYWANLPCAIYRFKPMPCTPAGDLIKEFPTAKEAVSYLKRGEHELQQGGGNVAR
jgi:hypothetical protein